MAQLDSIQVLSISSNAAQSFEFDGHLFSTAISAQVHLVEMAYRARRNDKVAKELLTKCRIQIVASDAKSYWPIEG